MILFLKPYGYLQNIILNWFTMVSLEIPWKLKNCINKTVIENTYYLIKINKRRLVTH